jgi:hypothetical protein
MVVLQIPSLGISNSLIAHSPNHSLKTSSGPIRVCIFTLFSCVTSSVLSGLILGIREMEILKNVKE